jgi:hypothetical protein
MKKLLLGLMVIAASTFGAEIVDVPPTFLSTEKDIKSWVERTIHDAPPIGGLVTMIKHWPLKYFDNDRVGKIWIVPALVLLQAEDGTSDHEQDFCVFHVDTGKSTLEVSIPVPDENLPEYLK